MSEFKSTGNIVKILDAQSGTSQAGKDWKKQDFVINTGGSYPQDICFNVFGDEAVENLTKYNKVGDKVTVSFNIKCNEYKGKYYTSLGAWRIEKVDGAETNVTEPQALPVTEDEDIDLPF